MRREAMVVVMRKTAGMSALVAAFCLLAIVPELSAAQLYVSPTGSDSAAGTIAQPLRTIPTAVTRAAAGDTIYLRGGTYALTTTIAISKNGTALNRYFLLAYPGERPLLDFSAMTVGSSNRGINLSGSYWTVRGIDIKGAGDNGMFLSGSHNIIEFCSFFENRDTGLQLGGGAATNQIINCDSYYNADPAQGNADGFAPKLDVGTGNSFYGCRAWQNSDDGYDGYLRPADDVTTTYENCWCFKNGYLKDGTASVGNGNGFKMGGSDLKNLRHNVVYTNCLSFENRVKGFDQNNNIGSITLTNCTAYNNGTNYKVDAALAAGKTLTVRNCAALGAYGSIGGFALQQTNSWLPPFVVTAGDFISTTSATAFGPRNADGSLPDITFMHLAAGSDLIDAGTDVGLPYNGTAPDLGAFESGVPVVTFTITASAGSGGTVFPAGAVIVESGFDTAFVFTPSTGYHVDSVIVDGVAVDSTTGYTFSNVAADHTIRVAFTLDTYTITSGVSGTGGTIAPAGVLTAPYGSSRQYVMTPDPHQHLDSLLVDGARVESTATYTFSNIVANHAIIAYFSVNLHTLAVGVTGNGAVTKIPDAPLYAEGTGVDLSALPDTGWVFSGWSGDTVGSDNPLHITMDANRSITATFTPQAYASTFVVCAGWNLLSLPVDPPDPRKVALYPSASSSAFVYSGRYQTTDSLRHDAGYWVKFSAQESLVIAGTLRLSDTVSVVQGWNIVGSLSVPFLASRITSLPPGLTTSRFFGYQCAGYVIADTIVPGRGYWVKASSSGKLVLSSNPAQAPQAGRIHFDPSSERPPAPPGPGAVGAGTAEVPRSFELSANYPNPFNPSTRLTIGLPVTTRVDIAVYTLLGERVRTLVAGDLPAGSRTIEWDGTVEPGGAMAASGIYVVRVASEQFNAVRKIMMVK